MDKPSMENRAELDQILGELEAKRIDDIEIIESKPKPPLKIGWIDVADFLCHEPLRRAAREKK
jgi:hypothetical protein